ncbi:MAG TPA: AAA family ATPase [Desulfobacterales bacterium]|nr:AAA family ATPase [Desulfobacterales bacterium]
MYLSHYRLEAKPFQICPDPRFLWLGEKHLKALGALQTAVESGGGVLILTGGVGTGKTMLINALVNSLGERLTTARVSDPGMEILDFLNFAAHGFGLPGDCPDKRTFIAEFNRFLKQTAADGRRALLIVDEAQRLPRTHFGELKRLLQPQASTAPGPLSILLVGQEEFLEVVQSPANAFLRGPTATRHHIQPLNEKETGLYVQHRLRVAGARRPIFRPDAIPALYAFSRGHPRLINLIADLALLTGFVKEKPTLGADLVQTAAAKLGDPFQQERAEADPAPAGGGAAAETPACAADPAAGAPGDAPPPAVPRLELSVPLPEAMEAREAETLRSVIGDLLREYAEELVETYAGELTRHCAGGCPEAGGGLAGDGVPDLEELQPPRPGRRADRRQTAFYLDEKRRHKRKRLSLAIDYTVGGRVIRDFIDDLGIGGVFIETRQRFSVGQTVTMTFSLPRSRRLYLVAGEVVRVEPMGIAVRFREEIDYA